MDKFAPVVPHHFYTQFLNHGYIPSSILLLAHDVVAHPKEYSTIFADPRWSQTTIFMDNSLVELKKAVDIKMVSDAVDIVGRRQVVILPDAMANSAETIKLTQDAWDEWHYKFEDHQTLIVIQGSSMQSFLHCAEVLEELEPNWVSIPRVTEGLFGYHRRELIPYIKSIFPLAKLHLLGFSDYIWEDLRAAAHPNVRSIDSAVPFRMQTPQTLSEKIPPRGDWWAEAKFSKDCIERVEIINHFINALK